jgi:hypothetical protein
MSIKRLSFFILGSVILSVAGYAGTLLFLTWPIQEISINKSGVFGDSFGPLTSFFTALGFGGLIITILLQQRQLRAQDEAYKDSKYKEEKGRYEEILFRLIDIYRQTLLEVQVRDTIGRSVLRDALNRIDAALIEEGVSGLPSDIQGRLDACSLTENDQQRIDYLHYRNFKIVGAEIHPQARLVDTFEVLLEHVVNGAPDHLLIDTYKKLVFSQITFLECRYFFLVALSHPNRSQLRNLLSTSDFFERLSRDSTHRIHRDMYKKYWGVAIDKRPSVNSIPMTKESIKYAFRAFKNAGGTPKRNYTLIAVRQSKKDIESD